MKDKYAHLIEQLERVTEAYNTAFNAAKNFVAITGVQPDILGVSGGITYLGDNFEERRAIHLDAKILTAAAIDCGSEFQCDDWDDLTRIECSIFGYRVFALVAKGSAEEAYLMDLAAAEAKPNE